MLDYFWLRPATNPIKAKERQKLIDRAIKMRLEIQLDFDTEAHWNRTHPNEEPLNAYDPDGVLRRWCDDFDAFLKSEAH